MDKIDFVIIWVDGNDEKWQKERMKYKADNGTDSSLVRYRDWDNLKYWFRGVEKFAPWVNKVYFVTCGHYPSWLNKNNPKLVCVKHSDYMPKDYLPTFSSHPIELNLHRINELSEKFVYFNDDMFIIKKTKPSDFFRNNLPCDSAVITPFVTMNNSVSNHIVINDYEYINKNFNAHEVVKKHPFKWLNPVYGTKLFRTMLMLPYKKFPGLAFDHLPNSYLKSSFFDVWNSEPSIMDQTSKTKFRSKNDISQWLIKWWQICKGNFYPRKYNIGKNVVLSNDNKSIYNCIRKQKYKMICINDGDDIQNFEKVKNELNDSFESILSEKSSFEL